MANVDGVDITLPSGDRFEFRGNISLQVEHQRQFLLTPTGSITGYVQKAFDELGSGDALQTPMATIYVGGAGGQRVFEIAADNWEGETGDFGAADDDDPVMEKLAVLEHSVATETPSSTNPATLEFGPFSSTTSRFDSINVVFPQLSPSVDFGDGPSVFRSRVTCAEAVDLTEVIDDGAVSADFRLTPAGASTPRIPIPSDTLGANGRGSGEQTQGREVAPSGLVDVNGASASPTSNPTKILPSRVELRGAWRGDGAAAIADEFRSGILTDSSVEAVELTAPGRSGPTPLTGTYTIDQQSSIDPLAPQLEDGIYGFDLVLRER